LQPEWQQQLFQTNHVPAIKDKTSLKKYMGIFIFLSELFAPIFEHSLNPREIPATVFKLPWIRVNIGAFIDLLAIAIAIATTVI
jgi:hypothetical protein